VSSPEAEAIFGKDPERDATFETWLERVHPDDRAQLVANWARSRAKPGVDIEHEYRFCRPDGNWRWIAAHGRLIFKDGKPIRTIGVIQDVTERRRLEGELRALTRGLETRVQEEIAARQAAQVRAAHGERMQALGQLAGGIAHDFNNVLQSIAGALRLITRRPGDPEGVRRLVQLATEATERGASVTRRLLAFGRRADLRTEAIDAESLLRDLHEILTHTLGAAIEVHIVAEPGLSPFIADRSQLETSLINLATNARDAMTDGGLLLLSASSEHVAPGAIGPAGLKPGNYVRLTIKDNGKGMDEAVLARASEPFFTTKKDGAGTGLGLAMAKGFVEQSGGSLLIESSSETGTCVSIWLPEAEATSPQRSNLSRDLSDRPTQAAGMARILLVDDDEAVRSVLLMELEEAGYSVLSAPSGAKAIEILDDGAEIDALVTDLSLPGMDGLAIIRAVQERRPGLPAILLTGYAGDGAALAVSGLVEGAFSLLRKPISAVQLIDRLEALLSNRADTPV
jgi:PAS domain S-box-containing protein